MKFCSLFLTVLSVMAMTSPLHALDFGKHVFFKHMIGEWKAEGELKGADGNVVTITETWKGKEEPAGTFFIEGSRTVNGDTQPFTWTITHNAATDGYEAILTGGSDAQPIRFEGSLSEVDLTMSWKTITGAGDSNITVQEAFVDEAKDTLESKVSFSGDQGQTTLEGKITNKRVKAP